MARNTLGIRPLKDLAISTALCLGERVAERFLLPGLHRSPDRILTSDPARADSLTVLVAEAFALFLWIWLFLLTLYAISYLSRRPLMPYATTLVMGGIVVLTFIASAVQWGTMPVVPR